MPPVLVAFFQEADKKILVRQGWGLWLVLATAALIVFLALGMWVWGRRRRRSLGKIAKRRHPGPRVDPWKESARRMDLPDGPDIPRERPAPGSRPPDAPDPGDDPVPGDE